MIESSIWRSMTWVKQLWMFWSCCGVSGSECESNVKFVKTSDSRRPTSIKRMLRIGEGSWREDANVCGKFKNCRLMTNLDLEAG